MFGSVGQPLKKIGAGKQNFMQWHHFSSNPNTQTPRRKRRRRRDAAAAGRADAAAKMSTRWVIINKLRVCLYVYRSRWGAGRFKLGERLAFFFFKWENVVVMCAGCFSPSTPGIPTLQDPIMVLTSPGREAVLCLLEPMEMWVFIVWCGTWTLVCVCVCFI